jgi:hypothetical protein
MQNAEVVLDVLRERGRRGLPLDELYRQMFNPPAPRGALSYSPHSGEGLEVTSLGPMAYLDSKEKGDSSMPSVPSVVPRRMG